jgi:hypothetical protein
VQKNHDESKRPEGESSAPQLVWHPSTPSIVELTPSHKRLAGVIKPYAIKDVVITRSKPIILPKNGKKRL